MLDRFRLKAALIWDIFDPSPLGHYRRLSRPVDGWLTRGEEAVLFRLARGVPRDECIVELGSWFGRSAILLGGGSRHGNRAPVFALDLFRAAGCAQELLEQRAGNEAQDFWNRFHRNLGAAGLEQHVTAIRGETAELGSHWAGPAVGLLFIDADHSYDGVSRDWHGWKSRLAPRARLAFHDYENPAYEGVTRFVNELVATRAIRAVDRRDSIFVAEVPS